MASAAVAVLALSACGQSDSPVPQCDPPDCVVIAPGAPIRLGTILSPTDLNGLDSLATVDLAIDYTDGTFDTVAGQVLGHDVEVVAVDDDCTRAGGAQAAKQLMVNDDVLGVIGTTCSESAFEGAAAVLGAQKVLMISPTNTSPLLTQEANATGYYFRTAFNDVLQAAIVADFVAKDLGVRTAATVSTDDAYSTPLAEGFSALAAAQGTSVVASPGLADSARSLRRAIASLRELRPGAVFLPMADSNCIRVVRAMKDDPVLSSTPIVVSEFCQTPAFLRALGDKAKGVYSSTPDAETLSKDDFYTEEFVPAYREFVADRLPIVSTQATFDAVNLELAAIRRVAVRAPDGGLTVNREDLRDAMRDISGYPGLTGPLECTPLGDCVRTVRMAIYEAPQWPIVSEAARPVYGATLTLEDVLAAS